MDLGTASAIWNKNATLTVAMLQKLRVAAAPKPAAGSPAPPAATEAAVTAMKQRLREQFDLADSNWQNWTPS